MTPNKEYEDERDAILIAFLDECPEPTPEQVAIWKERHPKFADEISSLAAEFEAAFGGSNPTSEPSPAERERVIEEAIKYHNQIVHRLEEERKTESGTCTETSHKDS